LLATSADDGESSVLSYCACTSVAWSSEPCDLCSDVVAACQIHVPSLYVIWGLVLFSAVLGLVLSALSLGAHHARARRPASQQRFVVSSPIFYLAVITLAITRLAGGIPAREIGKNVFVTVLFVVVVLSFLATMALFLNDLVAIASPKRLILLRAIFMVLSLTVVAALTTSLVSVGFAFPLIMVVASLVACMFVAMTSFFFSMRFVTRNMTNVSTSARSKIMKRLRGLKRLYLFVNVLSVYCVAFLCCSCVFDTWVTVTSHMLGVFVLLACWFWAFAVYSLELPNNMAALCRELLVWVGFARPAAEAPDAADTGMSTGVIRLKSINAASPRSKHHPGGARSLSILSAIPEHRAAEGGGTEDNVVDVV
jgi:hypothetical protein